MTWAKAYETSYTETSGASSAARQTPSSVNTAIGDLILVGVGFRDPANNGGPASVISDTAGNTYTLIDGGTSGSHDYQALYYTLATAASATNKVSITPTTSCTVCFDVLGFTGAASSSPLDKHLAAYASSTSAASGTSAATTDPGDLIVGLAGYGNSGTISSQAFTPSTTPTIETKRLSNVAGAGATVQFAWEVATATGTQAYAATIGSSGPNGGFVAAFKPAALGGARPRVLRADFAAIERAASW